VGESAPAPNEALVSTAVFNGSVYPHLLQRIFIQPLYKYTFLYRMGAFLSRKILAPEAFSTDFSPWFWEARGFPQTATTAEAGPSSLLWTP
jgi:hypothetical protein